MGSGRNQYLSAFKALADGTRLKILGMIAQGELCACEILESFQWSQPTLSYHMKLLTDSGLVHVRREGKKMLYTLNIQQLQLLGAFFQQLALAAEKSLEIEQGVS